MSEAGDFRGGHYTVGGSRGPGSQDGLSSTASQSSYGGF